ncbi:replicative DNA helicase [Plantactinospora sp. WMMB782]|uniref:replicative DNA helicase n=1 Tax=Plantactinospora sp. WMMB782 TaxID=3404121 RepID=UPI003B924DCA
MPVSVADDIRGESRPPHGPARPPSPPSTEAPPARDGQFDKTPPQDIAAEQCVLGGMLLSKDAIADVVEILRTNDFYRPVHSTVFDAILDLYGRGEPADAITVAAALADSGDLARIGGAPYLHTLIASVPTAANASYYARIVGERAVLRRLVEAGTRIVQLGYGSSGGGGRDVDDVVDLAQQAIYDVTEKRVSEDFAVLADMLQPTLDEIEAVGAQGGVMTGVPTGFTDLDRLLNGLHPGQLIIVAGRPGLGKALALDTPLPTPDGWTTMAEVRAGDHLLGADGRPTRVTHAFEVMHDRPCYEVEFSDGSILVADAEHLWRTTSGAVRSRAGGALRQLRRSGEPRRQPSSPAEPEPTTTPDFLVSAARSQSHSRSLMQAWSQPQPQSRSLMQAWSQPQPQSRSLMQSQSQPQLQARSLVQAQSQSLVGVDDGRRSSAGLLALAEPPVAPVSSAVAATRVDVVTTEQIRATLRTTDRERRPNHAVENCAPLELPERDLAVPPYTLGVWVGAGHRVAGRFGTLEPEVVAGVERDGFRVRPSGTDDGYTILPGSPPSPMPARDLVGGLGALGVLADRHLPVAYLRASEAQRRALLAGLMDAGGTVTPSGVLRYTSTSHRLALDVRELVVGLGYHCTVTTGSGSAAGTEPSTGYTVDFDTPDEIFRLGRKRAAHRARRGATDPCRSHPGYRRSDPSYRRSGARHIVAVRPVPSVPVRCVTVDNTDHLYLAGRSMIPTHNSTASMDFARNAAIRHNCASAIFSLEMSKVEIVMRLLSAEARVPLHVLRSGQLSDDDWTKLARRMGEISEAPLFVDDTPNMNLMEIRAKARRLKQRHDLKMIVVDYLQLMSSPKRTESRQQEVAELSRGLKLLAKEVECPVIAVSQLNRGPEQRTDKRPQLSDLRESGCLTAETRVLRADTGAETTMGELFATGARDVPVWALDDRLRYVRRHLTHVFSTGEKPVFRLRLASGREVRATANHPFLTYEGWTALGELAVGHRVAAPRHVCAPEQVTSWDDRQVVLLAHLIGDGSMLPRQSIRYASVDEANIEAVRDAATHFGITAARDDYQQARCTTLRLVAPYRLTHGKRNPVAAWADSLGLLGRRSHEKFVPTEVFSLPKDQIALFLRHLWATDGCVWTKPDNAKGPTGRIYYASTSRQLVDDVSRLLWRFGIQSRTRTVRKGGYRDSYHLHINGVGDQEAFCRVIGVHGKRGEAAAALHQRLQGVKANTNVDTIPRVVWERVRDVLAERGMTHRRFAAEMGTQFCGTAMWKRNPSRDRIARAAAILQDNELEMLATNDVTWDEIVSIEPDGVETVYDATVAGAHNFVANGIAVHNSIEQDADVVILLHRDDYYDKESPRAGEADFIVAKHRNGPTDTVTVAAQLHLSRFVDMAIV